MIRVLALGTTALASALCFSPAFAQAPAQPGAAILEEVVVTARRAEENLQTTPVAVTALGSEALLQAQVGDVVDLQRSVPSLTVATGAPSSSGFAFVSVRGQGNLQAQVSNDPAVAIYVDGVYIPRPSQGITDLNDLQRAEVLRGPQGTLFGRNTVGGALNILSNDPLDRFEGSVMGELGNFNHRKAGLILNVPIAQDLAARLVYSYRERDGFADNIPLRRDIADQSSQFGRGKLKYTQGGWDVTLSADYNKIKDNGQFAALKGFAPEVYGPGGSFGAFGLAPTLNASLHRNWYDSYQSGFVTPNNPLLATQPADIQNFYRNQLGNELEAYGGSATVNVDLGFAQLKSITAYRYSYNAGYIDTDGTPVPILTTFSDYESKQWSQELQLAGDIGERFNYITGFYYSKETGYERSISQTFGFLPPSPAAPFRGLASLNYADVENITTGVFAQGYYKVSDRLRATAGLRWTWDERNTVVRGQSAYGIAATCVAPGCALAQDAKFDYPAWTVGVDYQATDDIFLYAQTRGAAKSGGWNTRQGSLPAFDPEKVKDVEAGVKATWLDNRLRTNLAVFHAWQSDVQRNAAALTPAGNSTQFIVNAGEARVYGVELEVTAVPWEGMTINSSLSLMHGAYKSGSFIEQQTVAGVGFAGCRVAPNGVSSLCPVDRSGEDLPQLPEHQFNIGATQEFPTSFGKIVLHADYSYVGEQSFNPITAASQHSAAVKGLYAAENRLTKADGYGIFNGRVAVQIDQPNLEFALWGRNLTDEQYTSRVFSDVYSAGLGFASEFVGEPRTFGGTLTYRFGG